MEQVIYHSLEQPTKFLGIPQKGFSPAVGYILFLYAVAGERKQMRHPPQWSMPHYMPSFYKLRPRLILAPKGTMWCLSMVLNGRPIFSTEKRSGEMGSSHLPAACTSCSKLPGLDDKGRDPVRGEGVAMDSMLDTTNSSASCAEAKLESSATGCRAAGARGGWCGLLEENKLKMLHSRFSVEKIMESLWAQIPGHLN